MTNRAYGLCIAVVRKGLLFGSRFGECHEPALAANGVEDVVQLFEMSVLKCFNVEWHGVVMGYVGE